jgi:predicted transcriptional regulator
MAARILDKLRQSLFSVEELAVYLKRKPYEVRLLVNALLREGSIVRLNTDREGGPFYAPAGYVEASEKRDHSDQRLYRNYGGQIYDSPAWTDDV